mmetsp:Transcript_41733/g.71409  ORF Transcript_41733/g.71409 Transcript_41733/m.71409 type:complete len:85 (+) Transcript_41733:877-1131(+)
MEVNIILVSEFDMEEGVSLLRGAPSHGVTLLDISIVSIHLNLQTMPEKYNWQLRVAGGGELRRQTPLIIVDGHQFNKEKCFNKM